MYARICYSFRSLSPSEHSYPTMMSRRGLWWPGSHRHVSGDRLNFPACGTDERGTRRRWLSLETIDLDSTNVPAAVSGGYRVSRGGVTANSRVSGSTREPHGAGCMGDSSRRNGLVGVPSSMRARNGLGRVCSMKLANSKKPAPLPTGFEWAGAVARIRRSGGSFRSGRRSALLGVLTSVYANTSRGGRTMEARNTNSTERS